MLIDTSHTFCPAYRIGLLDQRSIQRARSYSSGAIPVISGGTVSFSDSVRSYEEGDAWIHPVVPLSEGHGMDNSLDCLMRLKTRRLVRPKAGRLALSEA